MGSRSPVNELLPIILRAALEGAGLEEGSWALLWSGLGRTDSFRAQDVHLKWGWAGRQSDSPSCVGLHRTVGQQRSYPQRELEKCR